MCVMSMRTADKPFSITKKQVYEAYKAVKSNGGAPGVDKQTIEQFEADLQNNLYKLWNRMSSGSYFRPPVRAVSIPKKSGGQRILGVPTVADRVAQMAVNSTLNQTLIQYFWQTPMAIGRGNPRSMPSKSRVSDAGDTIGFLSLISRRRVFSMSGAGAVCSQRQECP
jgi:retron-type reverse transcriptase